MSSKKQKSLKSAEYEKFAMNSTLRDFIVLSVSFLFTILIAFCTVLYINNQTQHYSNELGNIFDEFIQVNARIDDVRRNHRFNERKRDIYGENVRLRRALTVFQSTGENFLMIF